MKTLKALGIALAIFAACSAVIGAIWGLVDGLPTLFGWGPAGTLVGIGLLVLVGITLVIRVGMED